MRKVKICQTCAYGPLALSPKNLVAGLLTFVGILSKPVLGHLFIPSFGQVGLIQSLKDMKKKHFHFPKSQSSLTSGHEHVGQNGKSHKEHEKHLG